MNLPSLLDGISSPSIQLPPKESLAVARAAMEGLSTKQKFLPSWLFYDTAGSRLFEEITRLPEYYLTSLEQSIFSRHAADMVAAAAGSVEQPLSVVELGAGSATKTMTLLRAVVARQGDTLYLPVDVSEAALELASKNIHDALPLIEVQPICSEFTHEKDLELPSSGRRLALYIGSSIGNFDPDDAVDLLGWLRTQLQPGDALLLGTDMAKDVVPLLAAYNDRAGVTAEFNKNILARLNRELGANFELDAFEHRAIWNASASRIEMHLDSKCNQIVHVELLHRNFGFKRGESIHTENSYKFSPEQVEEMLEKSGYILERSWYDDRQWFGVHLARIVDADILPSEEDAAA
ncbi:MAG TPA: L-histidine N(alpha)-methyltransferase [Acidobacteriaceae bacterium]|nr:L-histidine N(alpha)-methyltransferase [Acidobacteriaceae bacterium]